MMRSLHGIPARSGLFRFPPPGAGRKHEEDAISVIAQFVGDYRYGNDMGTETVPLEGSDTKVPNVNEW